MTIANLEKRRPSGGLAWALSGPMFGSQVCLEAEDGAGGGGDDEAAKAAAAKEAADKAAAEKAAEEARLEAERVAEEEKRKKEGKVSDKEAELLRDVMDKKAKLKEAQAEAAKLQEQIKQFEGIDPVKVRELLKAQADAEKTAAEAKGDFERVKQMMADEHKKELDKIAAENAEKEAKLAAAQQRIDDLTIGAAFSGSAYINGELVLTPSKARTIYGGHFEIEDDVVVGYDKPKGAANRTKLVNASGDPIPFEEAVKKIVEADPDKDRLIRSKLKDGAGGKPATPGKTKKTEEGLVGRSRIEAALLKRGKK